MTEEKLCQYKSLKAEIRDQEKRLDRLYDREVTVVAGKVKASMKDFPYTEYRVGVQMEDPTEAEELHKLIRKKESRLKEARSLANEIEEFISDISESELRRIFELRFIDGMKQREIAEQLNIERSGISKKISIYLKFHTNHKNSVV